MIHHEASVDIVTELQDDCGEELFGDHFILIIVILSHHYLCDQLRAFYPGVFVFVFVWKGHIAAKEENTRVIQ